MQESGISIRRNGAVYGSQSLHGSDEVPQWGWSEGRQEDRWKKGKQE
ncbi:MAG: hypothetical protein WBD99_11235 [Thermodesulfobacteriota bacterium]